MLKHAVRALRLPFITASVLPFVFGSLIKTKFFTLEGFLLGLIAVVSTHLSANLLNDYADSKSGADWQDTVFYKFFGGSKLIQEKVLTDKFYLKLSLSLAAAAFLAVVILAVILHSAKVAAYYLIILLLSWSYSHKPLQFSYRMMGEVVIFLLFGPVLVMGAYFIQTGIFPDTRSFILSLPFGFLTTAILFANEVPDFPTDRSVGKHTWVRFVGENKSFILYSILVGLGMISIFLAVILRYLNPVAVFSIVGLIPAVKAFMIIKSNPHSKRKLMESSQLTIAMQTVVSVILILGIIL